MNIKDLEQMNAEDSIHHLQQIVLEAANDWPDQIHTTEDFVAVIEQKIGSIANKENIQLWMSQADILCEAWYMESLESLLAIYTLFDYRLPVKDIFCMLDNYPNNCR